MLYERALAYLYGENLISEGVQMRFPASYRCIHFSEDRLHYKMVANSRRLDPLRDHGAVTFPPGVSIAHRFNGAKRMLCRWPACAPRQNTGGDAAISVQLYYSVRIGARQRREYQRNVRTECIILPLSDCNAQATAIDKCERCRRCRRMLQYTTTVARSVGRRYVFASE